MRYGICMSRTSGQQSPASHFRTRASPSEGSSPKSMTENGFYSLICKHFIPTPGKNLPKVLSKLRTKCTTSEKKKVVPVMRVSPLSLLPFQSVENESLTPSVASGHQCHNSKATALLRSSFVFILRTFLSWRIRRALSQCLLTLEALYSLQSAFAHVFPLGSPIAGS